MAGSRRAGSGGRGNDGQDGDRDRRTPGVGQAAAVALAAAGWEVWAGVRDPADCADLDRAVAAAQVQVRTVAMDVCDPRSVDSAIATVLGASPAIDLIVNNAALVPVGPAEDLSPQDWEVTFRTNVLGPVHVIGAAPPSMRARGSGRILNIGSLAGRPLVGPPLGVAYNTSKAALLALTYEWNKELAPLGIRVQILELGASDTPGFAGIGQQLASVATESPYHAAAARMEGFLAVADASKATAAAAAAAVVAIAADEGPRVRFVFPPERAALLEPVSRLSDADFLELCATDTAAAYRDRLATILSGTAT